MTEVLTMAQLTGRDDSHLLTLVDGHRLHPQAALAFGRLQAAARGAGFDLAIASSYRSYERQLAIFNGKASGQRPVYDDRGRQLDVSALTAEQKLAAILRFSALPGTSRHHWGTDLDVFDAAAVPAGYRVQLDPAEVAPGGIFAGLHRWLDARMAAAESYGFYRPYAQDRGGVAVERWHLSYAPLARRCERLLQADDLRQCWCGELELGELVERELETLLARYVAVPDNWCPRP
ncbi:D-alanyl-D-alanine carboxypeptidase family protein [Seongchinamella sediminis]|uniref:D-alanyl-D-alanine carboxypeptidase family protein n=1 Tax=Seongchinamella sediminis TaxID=2283635 RepID=A0A3L7DWY3_9GAMM|nr:M15 family metallopeptidase [Seongchinamella sediminis]RLQ20471.1 D-alanyl-D-alanine carboxypeptidase family protein [Seongchinamella sediminis]